ncbi:threonine dehydratase [Dethiosulfatibacter aminovorans DSM 17477]|uniref:threonine ammonia-lyase n=1 Tax=Dethiosulfatibacter aminovorans DSM 17477 TaxID=1121476 RepID=A0A1M6HUU7_9FIRM|nr:threonine/serine dehydratase [Dethiosulfatibacter aminovorans]SHJ25951.1 threonine dehydratase [Dethiosulfatibacter aminovorans DSM 17477]
MVDIDLIRSAKKRIDSYLNNTILEKSSYVFQDNTEMYMKLESLNPVNRSYKIRGVISKLTTLSDEEKKVGVTAISSGNHGAALAYGASLMGIKNVEVYVPTTTPQSKVEKIRRYGGRANLVADTFDKTYELAKKDIASKGLTLVDPRDDEICIAGHGTIGLEIIEQLQDVDAVLVPIGSGGLITGIGSYIKQSKNNVKVYGVQTDMNPSMLDSFKENHWYEKYPIKGSSLCDALIGGISRFAYDNARECVDDILLVDEKEIIDATASMIFDEKLVAEPSSAITYAAYRRYFELFENRKTVLVITGSNIDFELLGKLTSEWTK